MPTCICKYIYMHVYCTFTCIDNYSALFCEHKKPPHAELLCRNENDRYQILIGLV